MAVKQWADLTVAERAVTRALSVTLPEFLRFTDRHGGGESEWSADEIRAAYNDDGLLSLFVDAEEVWMRYADGTSLTIRLHEGEEVKAMLAQTMDEWERKEEA